MGHGPFRPNCYIGDRVSVSGRLGLITAQAPSRKVLVQFGASGPFEEVWPKDLEPATAAQIREVTGT